MSLKTKYSAENPANRVRPGWVFTCAHPAHLLALFFGAGCLRPAPGTWGTLAGVMVWAAAVLVMALVAGIIGWGEEITPMLAERLETEIKYAGYIARQDRMIREVARHEKTLIPEDFEYAALTGLTLEAREKLARIRPRNLGQAGRIPGVSPSDVAQLSIALAGKQQK